MRPRAGLQQIASRLAPLLAALALPALPSGPAAAQDVGSDATAAAADSADSGDSWAEVYDPWESLNRGIFWFNEKVDILVLEPIGKAWDTVVPDPAERALARFFDHLRFPIVFGNDLLQLKPLEAASDVARFVTNTTVGVVGLFDPAAKLGLEKNDEDFGQTLGAWGLPPGPYFVIPLVGASSVRDTVGLVVDSGCTVYPWFSPFFVSIAVTGTDVVNDRSLALETVARERAEAIDFYAFVRNAHWSNRRARVLDQTEGETPAEGGDDFYYFEDEGLEEPQQEAPE